MQSLQSSCVLDSAPLWAGLGRASLCEVTGRIMAPGKGKGEEVIMKHLGLSGGECGNPWPLVIRATNTMKFIRKTSRH